MYYFIKIPSLPREFSHQDGAVDLLEYKVSEGDTISSGQCIAIVENWWARFSIKAIGKGKIRKIFFDPYTTISIGHPIAIIDTDPTCLPVGGVSCHLEVIKQIRSKIK